MENMNENINQAAEDIINDSDNKYQKKGRAVTEETLMEYISKLSKLSCKELVTNILWVWYSKSNLPIGVYAAFIAAIGYFVTPIDLVPDAIPVLGLFDDAAVLGVVIKLAKDNLTTEALRKAKKKVQSIFGTSNQDTIVDAEVVSSESL
ncbi:MAG: DUF1232 domain-containing protein [Paludibacteraceae bacterium]|nr:DUF1232 domain-containing protein [Paludibacteraceae bacterium]